MGSLHQYPRNFGGVALLLLRSSVGLLLLCSVHAGRPNAASSLLMIVATVMCIGLGVGILTQVLSATALMCGLVLLCTVPTYLSMVSVVTLLLCTATAILGAGAYSLDGVLFGRRRIII
jgi:hypothetical protein